MKNKSESGFGGMQLLLSLVIVALIAFVGFYVYHANKETDKTLPVASTASKNTAAKKPAKTLVMKELGIKITLDDTLKDVHYAYIAPTSDSVNKSGIISSPKFSAAVRACNSKTSSDPVEFATVTRVPGTYDTSATPDSFYATFSKQFTGFYIEFSHPDGGYCGGADNAQSKAVYAMFSSMGVSLMNALKNAQPVQ